ncbi:MAG TPA: Hsp20/alpha crystallin family protein [Solirubrobacter sp.]|nr:Hsp20/alpha crystallin family protein [Solirubrobacter sp.]
MTALTEPFPTWLRDLNRLFNGPGTVPAFYPPADVLVDDDGVTVFMDVPGVDREQLEIELDNEMLTLRGERQYPYGDDGDRGVRRVERGFGRFERSLRVPRGLDPDAIEASLTNGVLRLRIPKPESLRPRRIEITGGDERQ